MEKKYHSCFLSESSIVLTIFEAFHFISKIRVSNELLETAPAFMDLFLPE